MTSWGNREWTVLAGVGGAILLAMVGAPLSVDMVFLVGPDNPGVIGEQFIAQFCGAMATAAAILLARRWRWLLIVGAAGIVVAHAIRVPRPQGLSVRVGPSAAPEPDIAAHTAWACLLLAAAAVLLVGVLGAAQELSGSRWGAGVAGFAACAGFMGASIVGRLHSIEPAVRLLVVAAIAIVTVLAALNVRDRATGLPLANVTAGAAALVWLVPTMIVAIKGKAIFGTVTGGVVGLVVLAVAIVAARPTGKGGMIAVLVTGLVLAAPVFMLVLVYDVLLTGVWYAWPIAIGGVLLGVVAAGGPWSLRVGIVAAQGVSMIGLAAQVGEGRKLGEIVIWLFLALSMAAVATTVGSAAKTLAPIGAVPALAALGTLAALGVFGSLNLVRAGSGGKNVFEASWAEAILVLIAAGLLLVLRRTSAVRFDRSATRQGLRSR